MSYYDNTVIEQIVQRTTTGQLDWICTNSDRLSTECISKIDGAEVRFSWYYDCLNSDRIKAYLLIVTREGGRWDFVSDRLLTCNFDDLQEGARFRHEVIANMAKRAGILQDAKKSELSKLLKIARNHNTYRRNNV